MQFDSIYMAHVPGVVAMFFLVGLMLLLRRRYPRLDTGTWLVATSCILVAQLTWFLNGVGNPLRMHFAHSFNLLGQMLSGVALLFYEHVRGTGRKFSQRWLVVNTLPLVVFVTLFGFYLETAWLYVGVAAAGVAVLAVSSAVFRVRCRIALLGLVPLAPAGVFAWLGMYRMAAYWVLAGVYALGYGHLRRALPRRGIGRIPILVSMGLMVAVYATHAWALKHEVLRTFVDEVWTLQKYLLAIGMLLVLLEDQVVVNEHLAHHDALTGLPNRRSLMEWLSDAIGNAGRRGGKVTLLLVDLNGFKAVNDTHGHQAGDHLLYTLARRMRAAMDEDDLLVRLGGDEFVLASTRCRDAGDARRIEEELLVAIKEPVEMGGETLVVGGSFGMAMYPEDTVGVSAEGVRSMLLKVADTRMYGSKTSR